MHEDVVRSIEEWIAAWCIVARVVERPPQDEAALLRDLAIYAAADATWSGAAQTWAALGDGAEVDRLFAEALTTRVRSLRDTWEEGVQRAEPCGRSITIPADSLHGGALAVCSLEFGHEGPHADEEREAHWTDADAAATCRHGPPYGCYDLWQLCTKPKGHDGPHRNAVTGLSWGQSVPHE